MKVTPRNIFFNFVNAWFWDHLFSKLNNLGDIFLPLDAREAVLIPNFHVALATRNSTMTTSC
jgi:hypothetical protein